LTDFTHVSTPQLDTCSVADLLQVSPADVIGQLRLLLIVVCVLFGLMVVGGSVGFALDMRERARVINTLRTPAMGFCEVDEAWLWRFTAAPLRGKIDTPRGPAVALCELMGVPLARLRLALPDDALSWSVNTALGRAHGLSAAGFMSTAKVETSETPVLCWGARPAPRRSTKMQFKLDDDGSGSDSGDPEAGLPAERDLLDTFWGTALVLGFLQAASLLPKTELARRQSAARRHFFGVHTPAGATFDQTLRDCLVLLIPGVLNGEKKWLPRTRLWKLIFSQNKEGYWDISTTTAYAAQACSQEALEKLAAANAASKLTSFLNTCGNVCSCDDDALAAEEAERDASGNPTAHKDDMLPVPIDDEEEDDGCRPPSDCPLTFDPDWLARSLPLRLVRLAPSAVKKTLAANAAAREGGEARRRKRDNNGKAAVKAAKAAAAAARERMLRERARNPRERERLGKDPALKPMLPPDDGDDPEPDLLCLLAPVLQIVGSQRKPKAHPDAALAHFKSPGELEAAAARIDAHNATLARRAAEREASARLRMERRALAAAEAADAAALAEAMREPKMHVMRVWTTLCCIAVLERSPQCRIWGDGETYAAEEKTMVDAAREWIERYAAERPTLKRALKDGKLAARASDLTKQWEACAVDVASALRHSEGVMAQMTRSQVHRASNSVVRAFATKHDTLKVFLSVPLDGLQRWQSASMACSLCVSRMLTPRAAPTLRSVDRCGHHRADATSRQHLDVRQLREGVAWTLALRRTASPSASRAHARLHARTCAGTTPSRRTAARRSAAS
jgi:hypothetical protein